MTRYTIIWIVLTTLISCTDTIIDESDYIKAIVKETECPKTYWSMGFYTYCTRDVQRITIDNTKIYKIKMDLVKNDIINSTLNSFIGGEDAVAEIKKFICNDFLDILGISNDSLKTNKLGALQILLEENFYNVDDALLQSKKYITATEVYLYHRLDNNKKMIIKVPAFNVRPDKVDYNSCEVSFK